MKTMNDEREARSGGQASGFRVTKQANPENRQAPLGMEGGLFGAGEGSFGRKSQPSASDEAGLNLRLDELRTPEPLKIDFNSFLGEQPEKSGDQASFQRPTQPQPEKRRPERPQTLRSGQGEPQSEASRGRRQETAAARKSARSVSRSKSKRSRNEARIEFASPQRVTQSAGSTKQRKSEKRKKAAGRSAGKAKEKLVRTPERSVTAGAIGKKDENESRLRALRDERREKRGTRATERDDRIYRKKEDKSPDEKRQEIQNKKRRFVKYRARLIAFIAVIAALIIGAGVYFLGVAVITDCTIVNSKAQTYSEEEILVASQLMPGKSRMIFALQRSISSRLADSLPYIKGAVLERKWPHSLTLTIEETVDRFCLANGDNQVWLDERGKVLNDTKKKLGADQIKVYGFSFDGQEYAVGSYFKPTEANKSRFDSMKKISKGVLESGLKVKRIDFLSDESICLSVGKFIKIYANRNNDFSSKLKGVKDLIAESGEIDSDMYFDITQKDKIIKNYGTYS